MQRNGAAAKTQVGGMVVFRNEQIRPDHVGHQRQKGCECSNPQGYELCETLVREHGLLDQPRQGVGSVQAEVKKSRRTPVVEIPHHGENDGVTRILCALMIQLTVTIIVSWQYDIDSV
jgi:hypothetical protein